MAILVNTMNSESSISPEESAALAGHEARTREFLGAMTDTLGSEQITSSEVSFCGSESLPSVFAVSDFAAAAVGAAGVAVADFVTAVFVGALAGGGGSPPCLPLVRIHI
jgi:hypothetical protein